MRYEEGEWVEMLRWVEDPEQGIVEDLVWSVREDQEYPKDEGVPF